MQSLTSNVLSIDYPKLSEAEHVKTWAEAQSPLSKKEFDVIVLNLSRMTSDQISNLNLDNLGTQLVLLFSKNTSTEIILKITSQTQVGHLVDQENLYEIKQSVLSAIETAQRKKQEQVLESMVLELNAQLQKSYETLEERVEKRQAYLLEARKKTFIAQTKWELTKQTLIAIQQGISLSSIEQGLLDSLKYSFNLKSVRIVLHPLIVPNRPHFASVRVPLVKNQEILGTAVFYREDQRPFHKDEADFLNRLSEALSIAVDRLRKLEQTLTLKEQWQTTFNSVSDPIVLINEKYQIIQANHAFEERQNQEHRKTCYESFFNRSSPCENCKLGQPFRIEHKSKEKSVWDVVSQKTQSDPDYGTVFINLYHDVTSQVELERKIVESAKLAEIGTIGGSIAHELNNPLAGILSYVQLIKMDMEKSDPKYQDMVEMEQGVFRCRDIIENLLNFTRDPLNDRVTKFNLAEPIRRAIKVMELQTKSKGIEIKVALDHQELQFEGRFNLLSEAFRNILQNAIESVVQKLALDSKFRGVIEIRIQQTPKNFEIFITDNGLGAVISSTLSQSIANQIIRDHTGEINFNHVGPEGITAKITLPRPVFKESN